jgi:formylglycine-generating enzyme required for sulfatase activity
MTNQPLNNNMMKTTQNINRPNKNQLEPIHSTSLLTDSAAVFLKTSKQFLTVAVGAGVVLASAVAVQAVTIEMVTVGDAGNANDTINRSGSSWDTTSLGAVAYEYQIGKYEVTCEQYVEFLNAAAKSDPYGLYRTEMGTVLGKSPGITRSGSSPNYTYTLFTHAGDGGVPGSVWAPKPVGWMSKWDGVRFCNWLHNGQPSDGTGLQDGSYTLTGSGNVPDNAATVTRNSGATWVLPNDNEWHKAAYYKGPGGGYWDYPTQSDARPVAQLTYTTTGVGPATGGNYGNFSVDAGGWHNQADWYRTTDVWYRDPLSVGTSGGPSYYGAYDMAGNAAEYIDIPPVASVYLERGGEMHGDSSVSHVDKYQTDNRDGYSYDGFRVVKLGASTSPTYASWAGANGVIGGPSGDSNNDGVANGVAYFMKDAGLLTNPGIDGTGKVTWPNGGNIANSEYGVTKQFVVQTSSDLQTWADVDVGAVVLTNPNEVSYTLTGASPQFARLKVTPN